MIDNTTPALNDDEYRDLRRLKEILPSSRAIWNMTERWLIEAGLSPTPRGMSAVGSLWDGESQVRAQRVSFVGFVLAPTSRVEDWLQISACGGRGRYLTRQRPIREEPLLNRLTVRGGASSGVRPDPVGRGRGRHFESLPFANSAAFLRVRRTSPTKFRRWATSWRAKPLIRWWPVGGGLVPRGTGMGQVAAMGKHLRHRLPICTWVGQHYAMALMDRVRDAGRVIDHLSDRNAELHREIEEIRMGVAPEALATAEQRASDLKAEVTHLRSELKAAEEQNKGLQELLRSTKAEVRLARNEMLALNQKLEEVRAEARASSEALVDEIRQWPEKDKKLIEDYKKSSGFELGLTRTGQVTYEYGYRIALAYFKALPSLVGGFGQGVLLGNLGGDITCAAED
ncbi:hypothetical protein C4D60_Mb08t12940 [Musa balbisiana]|uniref:Uncharacterized protein n=1 Tax=Musa balbisiana TaxID=52838 RepID=A0A4S8K3C8_MUSBA|nr:hypothetical protein C4D60_Mb08t12940 [Musa balbisiana]